MHLQTVKYAMTQLSLALEQTISKYPAKPYCSDNLSLGIQIRPKAQALLKKYIQPNHPYYTHFFVFDLDYPTAYVDLFYEMIGVPTPNLVVENPENGHAHFLFKLETPVFLSGNASPKPIRYLNAVYGELREIFGADKAYTGLMSKNPLHEHWRTQELQVEPYSLAGLAQHLELKPEIIKQAKVSDDEAFYEGRNHRLFTELKQWAYVAVRDFRGKTYQQWLQSCLDYSMQLNSVLVHPLGYGEIKQIAKSVSKFCWKNDAYCYAMFIDRQTMKAKVGGTARSANYEPLREQATILYADGMKKKDIALELGVSDRTIRNWLK